MSSNALATHPYEDHQIELGELALELANELNERQLRFVELIAFEGHKRTDAYQQAFQCENRNSARANACRLMANANVAKLISVYRDAMQQNALMSGIQKRAFLRDLVEVDLTSIVDDEGNVDGEFAHLVQKRKVTVRTDKNGEQVKTVEIEMPDKLKAIALDNELAGHNSKPTINVKAEGGEVNINFDRVFDDVEPTTGLPAKQAVAEVVETGEL